MIDEEDEVSSQAQDHQAQIQSVVSVIIAPTVLGTGLPREVLCVVLVLEPRVLIPRVLIPRVLIPRVLISRVLTLLRVVAPRVTAVVSRVSPPNPRVAPGVPISPRPLDEVR